jgi:hypothetical protein
MDRCRAAEGYHRREMNRLLGLDELYRREEEWQR